MVKLFKANGKDGDIFVNVKLKRTNNVLEIVNPNELIDWLNFNYDEIYWDIELQEGGSVSIRECRWDGDLITFKGDNGIWEMKELELNIETV